MSDHRKEVPGEQPLYKVLHHELECQNLSGKQTQQFSPRQPELIAKWQALIVQRAKFNVVAELADISGIQNQQVRKIQSYALLRLQRPVEKRQAHIHPVINIGVVVVEFLVSVADTCCREAFFRFRK